MTLDSMHPSQVELLRLEFPRYFTITINKVGIKARHLIVYGNLASKTSVIELIVHASSVDPLANWLNDWAQVSQDKRDALLAKSNIEFPMAGEVYRLQGVAPVVVDTEKRFVLLSAESYH